MSPAKKLKIVSRIYLGLCFCGLTWHVFNIADPYFRYNVLSTTTVDWPLEEYKRVINFGLGKFSDYNITISDIWESSLSIDFMPYVMYVNNSHSIEKDQLIIKNYFYDMFRFYSFEVPEPDITFNREQITFHGAVCLMEIYLEISNLSSSEFFSVIFLSDVRESPLGLLHRGIPFISLRSAMIYQLNYNNLNIHKLQSPYTDKCIDYSYVDCKHRTDCITKCLDYQTDKHFNKVSKQAIHKSPINKTYFDFEAASQDDKSIYDEQIADCVSRYQNPDCVTNTVLTSIKSLQANSSEMIDTIGLIYSLSDSPTINILSKIQIPFIDFITFIFGSLGTWLGFSFMMCLPAKHMKVRKVPKSTLVAENTNSANEIIGLKSKCNHLMFEIENVKNKLSQIKITKKCK